MHCGLKHPNVKMHLQQIDLYKSRANAICMHFKMKMRNWSILIKLKMHIDSMEAMPISGRIIRTEIYWNFCWDNETGMEIDSQERLTRYLSTNNVNRFINLLR